jgi:hypothetical protein
MDLTLDEGEKLAPLVLVVDVCVPAGSDTRRPRKPLERTPIPEAPWWIVEAVGKARV